MKLGLCEVFSKLSKFCMTEEKNVEFKNVDKKIDRLKIKIEATRKSLRSISLGIGTAL